MNRFRLIITLFSSLLIFASLGLAGCNSPTQTQSGTGGSAGTPGAGSLVDTYPNATSVRNQLLLGTIKLEGTPDAVTSEQARKLLPLLQAYKGLTTSGSTAQQELDAVLSQIQKVMTPDQVLAIGKMKLTAEDLNAYYDSIGLPQPTPPAGATSGAGQNLTQAEKDARRAANGQTSTGASRGTALIDSVIKLVTERAA